MAYKVTMGKLAAQKGKEFDEVMEYRDAFQATVSILMGKEVTLLDKAETEKRILGFSGAAAVQAGFCGGR